VSFNSWSTAEPTFKYCFYRRLRVTIRTIDNWTAIAIAKLAPGHGPDVVGRARAPGETPRVVGQRPGHLISDEGTGVRVSPTRPGACRLCYRPRGRHSCPSRWWFGRFARTAGAKRKRPWLNGESTCLRSRGLQVRVLPGVLCPKQKRAMHRDVAPEEAGSSPAGHPEKNRTTHYPSGTLGERRNRP
jgi:hypothetical protein